MSSSNEVIFLQILSSLMKHQRLLEEMFESISEPELPIEDHHDKIKQMLEDSDKSFRMLAETLIPELKENE